MADITTSEVIFHALQLNVSQMCNIFRQRCVTKNNTGIAQLRYSLLVSHMHEIKTHCFKLNFVSLKALPDDNYNVFARLEESCLTQNFSTCWYQRRFLRNTFVLLWTKNPCSTKTMWKKGHLSEDCMFENAVCNFCKRKGHLQSVCRKKKQLESEVKYVAINSIYDEATAAVAKLEIPVKINDPTCTLELDTAAGGSFCLFLRGSSWEGLSYDSPASPTSLRRRILCLFKDVLWQKRCSEFRTNF